MVELLKNLKLDHWYKMLLLACFGLLVLSLTVPLQVIPNAVLMLMSLGGFLVGMGEWINHPYHARFNPVFGVVIEGRLHKPHVGGIALDVVGAVFVAWGLWKLIVALS
ncbi:MAG: hypothetical protein FWD62_05445 [Betaproteobacteria bacterium]|nr:hypothetical protein [Betaproteobacteria bacterium]